MVLTTPGATCGVPNYVMCSDLQCLDHVRVAVVPACLWLIGGGAESRPVMSLQNASRRARCHRRDVTGQRP